MRVAFVVNNYPPRVGGLENHVAALARRLAENGHDVVVHTLSETNHGASIEHGVRVVRWPELFQIGGLLGFPTPRAARAIVRAVRADADAISVHTRFFPLTWLGVFAAGRRIPVVHTEHGSDHVASPSRMIRWGSRLVDVTLGRWSLRRAGQVVGVSDEVVAFVARLAGVRARVFFNAIEMPVVTAGEIEPRRHLVFVGRMVPGKGWEDFLDAVRAQDADVTGEVLGDGSDLPAVHARVAELGLEQRVGVRGRVPPSDVFAALAGAILVNPTRLSEGFQTTLLEALAVGARVVTYPVPGVDVLTADGAPLHVVDADPSALAAGVRQALVDAAEAWPRERVAAWTWPVRAREYEKLLAAVTGGGLR